jgi:GT2 family glycosyltransferase
MTSASLIVINWNGAAFLDVCLHALLAQATAEDEIIVVDNYSTDHSLELVRSSFPHVKLICNQRNLGYAGGANTGLRAARGEVRVLLNPDVKVHAGWLSALKATLEDKRIGVVGCKLYYPGGKMIQHAGGIIRFPLATADHYGYRQHDEGQWDHAREVDFVTGAVLALRRDILDAVGFFDEGFYPAYYEEVDYCFRVRRAGYGVRYTPQAVATHHEHASLQAGSPRYLRLFLRSRLRFVLKHCETQDFLEGFVPAETRRLLERAVSPNERQILPQIYLEAMLTYPHLRLDFGPADGAQDDVQAVLKALTRLRYQVAALPHPRRKE